MLENIEAIMFLDPENIDSLVNLIDTTSMSLFEQARLSSIRGKMYIDRGEYSKSIGELEKADSIFMVYKNSYHQYLSKYIKATVLERLQLYTIASELYIECAIFFDNNNYDKLRFYTSLGILRMNNILKISTNEIISDLENDVKKFNNPLFTGLLYATMGHIGANDSISMSYFPMAASEFKKVNAWSRVYNVELNMLLISIRQDSSDNAQHYYYSFPNKEYPYPPNQEEQLRYLFAEGYLLTCQKKYSKAIDITNEVLKKARSVKSSNIEIQCAGLLEYLYKQIGDFSKAHRMLVRYNDYRKKEMDSLEQVRLLALGSHYRFTKLENERQRLRSRMRINLLVFGLISLSFAFVLLFNWNRIKQGKLREEILKLSNIEIKDQIGNLYRSFEKIEGENTELIGLVEELESKYLDSRELAAFSHKIDNNTIKSWIEFENFLSEKHPGLIEALKEIEPELSPIEIKYCMCICVNLNNYEISKLLNVGENAVKSAKRRIRDKLALKNSREIYLFLKSLTK